MFTKIIHALFCKPCITHAANAQWVWVNDRLCCPKCGAMIAYRYQMHGVWEVYVCNKYQAYSQWICLTGGAYVPSLSSQVKIEETIAILHKRDPTLDEPLISDQWEEPATDNGSSKKQRAAALQLQSKLFAIDQSPLHISQFKSIFDNYKPPAFNGQLRKIPKAEVESAKLEYDEALSH